MSDNKNTVLWDRLGRTNPEHTKEFKRPGGFKGTAIKPIWSYHRMTEEFGPCGTGWGPNKPEFQLVPAGDELLVYCTVSVWYGEAKKTVFGVGGDKVLIKTDYGTRSDDEAFKKAHTDAITNALKMIGVGADVHMGLFEDSKYVSHLREEFSEKPKEELKFDDMKMKPAPKNVEARELFTELQNEFRKLTTVYDIKAWWPANEKRIQELPPSWQGNLRDEWRKHGISISGKDAVRPNSDVVDEIVRATGGQVVNDRIRSTLEAGE